jgi:hypothetical protein
LVSIVSALTDNGCLSPYSKIPPNPHQLSITRPFITHITHNFRVQVLVARGRSEWFVKVVVSAATFVGSTPAVIVAAPAPTWPSIPMTANKSLAKITLPYATQNHGKKN